MNNFQSGAHSRWKNPRRTLEVAFIICLTVLFILTGCGADKNPTRKGTKPVTVSREVEVGRRMLVEIINAVDAKFPQVEFYREVHLDLISSGADEPTEVGLAASSRGNAIAQWQEFTATVASVATRYGFTAPKTFEEGASGNRLCSFRDGQGRTLRIEASNGTILDLMTPAVSPDAPGLTNGVVWRDGKNVMEPRTPS